MTDYKKELEDLNEQVAYLEDKLTALKAKIKFYEKQNAEVNQGADYPSNNDTKKLYEDQKQQRIDTKLRYLSRAVEQSPCSIVITNKKGNIEYVNPKFVDLTGFELEDVIGKNPRVLNSGEKTKDEYKGLFQTLLAGKEWRGEFHNRKKNGESYWEMASISGIIDDSGEITHFLAVKEDITARKQMELELKKLSQAVEQSPTSILITNKDGIIEYVNSKFVQFTGYSEEEVIGQNPRILKSGETTTKEYENLWSDIIAGKEWHGEFHNRKKNGELYWEYTSLSAITNEKGEILYFLGVKEDITERKKMEESLRTAYETIKVQQKKMASELIQARETQKSLLPEILPEIPSAKISCMYKPMDEIGGDFYDIVDLGENKFGIMVADVTGHGVPAALISFMVSGVFAESVSSEISTKEALMRTNESLYGKLQDGKFATMFYGIYDASEQTLTYTTASHPEGLVVRASTGEVFRLATNGLFIGPFPNEIANYEKKVFQLQSGDKLLLYTDAIIEIADKKGQMMGIEGLSSLMQKYCNLSVSNLLDEIYREGLE
ncbi:MAG: PAS domain S-box-containing protein, partial [bacterium]